MEKKKQQNKKTLKSTNQIIVKQLYDLSSVKNVRYNFNDDDDTNATDVMMMLYSYVVSMTVSQTKNLYKIDKLNEKLATNLLEFKMWHIICVIKLENRKNVIKKK